MVTPGHKTFGPRRYRRLTKARVEKLVRDQTDGRHLDGGGLSLRIVGGSATWQLSYRFEGGRREISLGSARSVGLEDARQAVEDARRMLRLEKRDPQAHRAARAARRANEKTFAQTAALFVDKLTKDGRDAKTVKQASAWLLGVLPGGKKADTNYSGPLHRTCSGTSTAPMSSSFWSRCGTRGPKPPRGCAPESSKSSHSVR